MTKSKLPHLKEGKVVPYSFIDATKQEVVDLANEVKPIKLSKNEGLINRIAERYPHIAKSEIAIIVKYAFSAIREVFILGKILCIYKLFHMTHIHFYRAQKNGKVYPAVRIVSKTPKGLK